VIADRTANDVRYNYNKPLSRIAAQSDSTNAVVICVKLYVFYLSVSIYFGVLCYEYNSILIISEDTLATTIKTVKLCSVVKM